MDGISHKSCDDDAVAIAAAGASRALLCVTANSICIVLRGLLRDVTVNNEILKGNFGGWRQRALSDGGTGVGW